MAEDTNAPADAEGALSVESAMEALASSRTDVPERQEADQTPEKAAASQETPPADEPAQAAPDPQEQVISAPDDWADEDKAWFATLEPERQARFAERAKASAQPQPAPEMEAARRALDEQVTAFRERNDRLGDIVDAGTKAFQEKWGKFTGQDWQALAQSDPDKYVQVKAAYDAETDALRQADAALKEARQTASAEETRLHMEALARELPTIAPDLADIKSGKLAKTVDFLRSVGVPAEAIPKASAIELALAHDAMQYREGKKALAAAPKPAPQPARPTPKPSAAPAASSATRNANAIAGQLKKSGSVDDAVALLQARRATT